MRDLNKKRLVIFFILVFTINFVYALKLNIPFPLNSTSSGNCTCSINYTNLSNTYVPYNGASHILNINNITSSGNTLVNYLNVSSTATIDNIQFNKYGAASRILLPTNSYSYIGTDSGATWLGYCTGNGIWFFGVQAGDIVIRGTNTKRLHLGVDNANADAYAEMTFDINGIAVNTNYSVVAPSSRLNLPAGDYWPNRSALKFTTGPLLLTPEAGAVEYNATDIFITNDSNVRLKIATFNASKSGISAKGTTCTITEITNGIITGGSCV